MAPVERRRRRNRYIVLALVLLVFGFILSYSYRLSQSHKDDRIAHTLLQEQDAVRQKIVAQKERNRRLTDEVRKKQLQIRRQEREISNDAARYAGLAREAEALRLSLGEIEGEGPGIAVSLRDGEYNPAKDNPNDYLVHESHVLRVVHELRIAGAEAISINGKRLSGHSFIKCTGPVITVDDQQFPAPFLVAAVGNPETLAAALNLKGGVADLLRQDRIFVSISQAKAIRMAAAGKEAEGSDLR